MTKLNAGAILCMAMLVVGCATHYPPQARNSTATVSLLIAPGRSAQEYIVQATIADISSSTTIAPSAGSTNFNLVDLLQGAGHADALSVPRVSVVTGQWVEISMCSTNTPGIFTAEARMGEDDITVRHAAGILLKVKIVPMSERVVRAKGILSIGTEDVRSELHDQKVFPFFVDCPVGKPTVIFQKGYVLPSAIEFRMIPNEGWQIMQGTTNTCTLPSRSRAGK